jgi:DNA-binding response OmpR family regulator
MTITGFNHRRLGVLIVEDDPAHALLLEKAFSENFPQVRVQTCSSGTDLQRLLQAPVDKEEIPHLLCLDLRLPDLSAIELLNWIRSQPHLAAMISIIVSAFSNPSEVDLAYRAGARAYMPKGADFSEFKVRMSNLVNFWLGSSEFPPRDLV